MRLQITSIAVSRNIRRREGGSILNLIKENPADRAINTPQPQPLIIRAVVAIEGCLDFSRFFVQILIRDKLALSSYVSILVKEINSSRSEITRFLFH